MKVEYARKAIDQVHDALWNERARLDGVRVGLEQRLCPRHGSAYVVRRGTNRCPVGRKRKVNCL